MAKKNKDPQVNVRMYRQGLGDCFLVTIGSTTPFSILIDCGVWDVSKEARARMRRCVENLRSLLPPDPQDPSRRKLDLLVITHEHWDHVSGFSELQARDIFDSLTIGELLLPWTENPDDPLATTLRDKFQKLRLGLQQALDSAKGAGLALGEASSAVMAAGGLALGTDPGEALAWIKKRSIDSPTTKVTYGAPGDVLNIPGASLYVLGPPHDEAMLRKHLGGASAEKSGEAYLHAAEIDELEGTLEMGIGAALSAAQRRAHGDDDPYADHGSPFPAGVGRSLDHAREDAFFSTMYGTGAPSDRQRWRRIDTDWTSSISQLALRMDKFTNNTSLALAIELSESRRVLLFPGDAQFGNWMSWDGVQFKSKPDTTTEDLLRRTVLYKVGHHGSHNATLRKRGIDRMTSEDLVAMIPVDEAFARKQPNGGWSMPYPALFQDLKARTQGRVLRVDAGLPHEADVKSGVRAKFARSCKVDRDKESLWIEYRL